MIRKKVKKWENEVEKMQEKNEYFFNAKVIAKKKIYFKEIESTQTEAKKLAEEGIENGTIVYTDYQTKGMGTHDRIWYSEKNKNIAFTLILYPKCTVEELQDFTVDIAKCMNNAIDKLYSCKLEIKEPNDIVYQGKKIGGILTQIVTSGETIRYLLIGIGMNVNGEKFPTELKETATSLKKEFGREFSKEEIMACFCQEFEKYCLRKKIL